MVRKIVGAAVLGLFGVSCHTITEELPPRTTTTGPAPIPVVVVTVPIPTPPPRPTPPPPTSSPVPAPGPSAPPTSSCALPPGTGSGENCPYEHPSFLPQVEAAIDQLVRERPGIFNLSDTRGGCDNCYFIRDSDAYWEGVTQRIQQGGLCATNDGEELAVKNNNNWNDQYDIITGDGHIRRQLGAYRSTCHPAWF